MDENQRETGRYLVRWLGILFGIPLVLALVSLVPAVGFFAVPIAIGLIVRHWLLARRAPNSGRGLTVGTGLAVATLVVVAGRELLLLTIILVFGAS